MEKQQRLLKQLTHNKRKGFSLIEILIVLAIVGLLMAVIIPRVVSLREQTQKRANIANAHKLIQMLEAYYLAHGSYPYNYASMPVAVDISTLLVNGRLTGFVAEDTTNLNGTAIKFINPFTGNTYAFAANSNGNIRVTFGASESGHLVTVYGKGTSVIKKINFGYE